MEDMAVVLEHSIPDVVSTPDLPVALAAEIDFLAGRVDRWMVQSGDVSAAMAARSLAFAGRAAEARTALLDVDVDRAGSTDLAAAAWAASRVGGPTASALSARLGDIGEDFIGDRAPVGPAKLFTGMLRGAAGDIEGAVEDLSASIRIGDMRAPIWGALGRLELSRVLGTAAAVPLDGFASGTAPLTAARTFFAAGGYASLLQRVGEVAAPVRATLLPTSPGAVGFGTVPVTVVRSSKGLVALHHLVVNRDRVVTAAELAVVLDGGDAGEIAALLPDAWRRVIDGADGHDLKGAAADASVALRRVFFDDRTRSRVSKLLHRTIDKLGESCPPLSSHLKASVRTGHGCRYGAAGAPVDWTLFAD